MKAVPIEDGILFTFEESTLSGMFENATDWGFVVKDSTQDPKTPRWGKVIATGPKVTHIAVDQYILVESLMWTTFLTLGDGDRFWKTNEAHVMCVSDAPPSF